MSAVIERALAREPAGVAIRADEAVDWNQRLERLAGAGVWEWSTGARQGRCTDRAAQLLGLPAPLRRASIDELFAPLDPQDRDQLAAALGELERTGIGFTQRVRTSLGADFRLLVISAELACGQDGEAAILGLVRELDAPDADDPRSRRLGYYDSLTELPNRLLLREQIGFALRRAQRDDALAALLSLDIDNFRRINQTFGHAVGDQLLRAAARRLGRCVRTEDLVAAGGRVEHRSGIARMGADEFGILLSRIAEPLDAARVARRVVEALVEPFVLAGHEIFASVSVGVAIYPWDAEDADSLVRCADTALGHVKDGGVQGVRFFNRSMNQSAAQRLALETDLRRALEAQELLLHYQPRVDSRGGCMVGAEALLRWNHAERGLVSPGEFIPLAEQTRLIIPIGAWVLEQACRQNRMWQERGLPPVPVSVNVSAIQFHHPSFEVSVRRALQSSGLDPQWLELEITESAVMHDVGRSKETIEALKAQGLRFAIDDFGTGFSSLSYLKTFPVDILKIDRSFVQGLPEDRRDASIACAVIDLASRLGMQAVAEGIETVEQRLFLEANGCHEMQGFLFARPMEPADFELRWRHPEPFGSPR